MNRDRHETSARDQAEQLSREPRRAADLARRAAKRANRFESRLGEGLEDLRALTRLVGAWARGEYRAVPVASIVSALGALVYFLMPLDAIPDFVLAMGFVDDLAVLARVVHYIRGDLADFRAWEKSMTGPEGSQSDV
jgi:uncharacterized membrane protein YkvA (DUF1232 family)